MSSPHAGRLERWVGKEDLDYIQKSMKDWYGPPVALLGIPEKRAIFVTKDGDFIGQSPRERFTSLADWTLERTKASCKRFLDQLGRRSGTFSTGIASVSDLIAAATFSTGGRRQWQFQKTGVAGALGISSSLWRVGAQPVASAAPSNAPGGDIPTNIFQGALPLDNVSTAVRRLVSVNMGTSLLGSSLLLYDRLFEVNKTMSSTATEAVTGSLTRYTSQTATAEDYCGGNFIFIEVQSVLSATGHNWTVCKYTNQAGTTGQTLPSVTGVSAAVAGRFDSTASSWFCPLSTSDAGVFALTQMQCSASVTGAIAFMIGHPIGWIPNVLANCVLPVDFVNEEFSLPRIFDSASLAFIEGPKPAATATNYWGEVVALHA